MIRRWLLAALFAAAMTTTAAAHDWYPIECCSGMDCAPVEKVEILSPPAMASMLGAPAQSQPSQPGAMLITTKHGSVAVAANVQRRESKDHRMHACMRPGDGGGMRLICIFMPPAM